MSEGYNMLPHVHDERSGDEDKLREEADQRNLLLPGDLNVSPIDDDEPSLSERITERHYAKEDNSLGLLLPTGFGR